MDLFKAIVFIISFLFIQEIQNNEILLPHNIVKRNHESDIETIKLQPTKAIDHHADENHNDANLKHTGKHIDTTHIDDLKSITKPKLLKENVEDRTPETIKSNNRPTPRNSVITKTNKPLGRKKNYKIVLFDNDNDAIDKQANITGIEDITDFISQLDALNDANSNKLNNTEKLQKDIEHEKDFTKSHKIESVADKNKTLVHDYDKKVENKKQVVDHGRVTDNNKKISDDKLDNHNILSKDEVKIANPKDNSTITTRQNKVEKIVIETINTDEKIYEETYKKDLVNPSPWSNIYCFNNTFYLGKSINDESQTPKMQPGYYQNYNYQKEQQNTPDDYPVTYETYGNTDDVPKANTISEEPTLENYWKTYSPTISNNNYYDQARYFNQDAVKAMYINQYNNKMNNQKANLLRNKGSITYSNPTNAKAVNNPQVYLNRYNSDGTTSNNALNGMPSNYYNLMKRAWINRKAQFDMI